MIWHRFWADKDGTIAVGFGLSTIVLLSVAGGAIDYSRWHHAQQQTQVALDAAVLAAGRTLQLEGDFNKAKTSAQAYFAEQVNRRLPVTGSSVTFTLADSNTAIVGTATAKIETPLMGLANLPEMDINVSAKAAFSAGGGGGGGGSDLEIALMLDVTGSMCTGGEGPCTSSPKLDALKTAATDLINVVIKDGATQTTRVALVPFSTRVRVGLDGTAQAADMVEAMTNLPQKWNGWYNICVDSDGDGASEGAGNWECLDYDVQHVENWEIMPCVTDRTGGQQYTDAAPGANAWLNAHGGNRFPQSWDSSNTAIASGDGLGQNNGDPAEHWNYVEESDVYCSDVAQTNMIMPLTDNKDALEARISGLEAYGATSGTLGTAMSYYTLSPNWASVWNILDGGSAPGPYSDVTTLNAAGVPKLRKIAVIMTDGVYNTHRGWKKNSTDADYAAHLEEMSDNAVAVCNDMKHASKGIEIFTVGFDLDSLSTVERTWAERTLTECGTDIDHFYNTLDTAQLKQAFTAIALSLSQLYLAR